MKISIFFLLVFLCYSPVFAQKLLKTIATQKIITVSADRYGNIFVADRNGTLTQYDSSGHKLNLFSPPQSVQVNFIEAWRAVKIFVFYRDLQKIVFLNRFLTEATEYNFSDTKESSIGFARLVTLANDDNLWLYDDTDFSLKKYNPERKQILLKTTLNLLFENPDFRFNFIREYENLLFLNDYNVGIRVFDNLGNYKKLIPFKNLNYIGFLNEELYFYQNHKLHFFNLYSFQEREMEVPSVSGKIQYVLAFERRLVIFTEKEIFIFGIS